MDADSGRLPVPPGRRDALALGLLFGVPLVALAIPALAGYPLLTGDDLAQNFPLSAYVGQVLRHGHLPVFNPYLWSGAPLLAAANAHALLGTTWLFAVLPALVAWVLAEALTLGAAAAGVYVLLRRSGCGPLASALAGATFGLGGFVVSQAVHIDFVAAAAGLVWILVALHGLCRGRRTRAPAWALLLAAAAASTALAASPDIAVDVVVVVGLYGGQLWLKAPGRRVAVAGWALAGAATGALLAAVQWLPTAEFVAVSQRAHPTYAYATAGSLSLRDLLVLLAPTSAAVARSGCAATPAATTWPSSTPTRACSRSPR